MRWSDLIQQKTEHYCCNGGGVWRLEKHCGEELMYQSTLGISEANVLLVPRYRVSGLWGSILRIEDESHVCLEVFNRGLVSKWEREMEIGFGLVIG